MISIDVYTATCPIYELHICIELFNGLNGFVGADGLVTYEKDGLVTYEKDGLLYNVIYL